MMSCRLKIRGFSVPHASMGTHTQERKTFPCPVEVLARPDCASVGMTGELLDSDPRLTS